MSSSHKTSGQNRTQSFHEKESESHEHVMSEKSNVSDPSRENQQRDDLQQKVDQCTKLHQPSQECSSSVPPCDVRSELKEGVTQRSPSEAAGEDCRATPRCVQVMHAGTRSDEGGVRDQTSRQDLCRSVEHRPAVGDVVCETLPKQQQRCPPPADSVCRVEGREGRTGRGNDQCAGAQSTAPQEESYRGVWEVIHGAHGQSQGPSGDPCSL